MAPKKRELTKTQLARLDAMNKHLYPAHLVYRPEYGTYRFEHRRDGCWRRVSLGSDIELAYDRALLMRRELDSQQARDVPILSSRQATLAQYYELYAAREWSHLAVKTVYNYRLCWRHIAPLHDVTLAKLTAEMISEQLATIVGKESLRDHVGVFLSILLRAAVKDGVIQASPWTHSLKRQKRDVPILTRNELARVFAAASPSSRPIFVLAGFLGLRREEIFGLQPRDIQHDARLLTIRRTRVHAQGVGIVDQPRTKSGSPRVLPISDEVYSVLLEAAVDKTPNEYLFPFRHDLVSRLRAACRRAGVIDTITMHDLRHICGSNLMMEGGATVAQAVLGHKDLSTTADVYGHLSAAYLAKHIVAQGGSDTLVLPPSAADALAKILDAIEVGGDNLAAELAPLAAHLKKICPVLSRDKKKDLTLSS